MSKRIVGLAAIAIGTIFGVGRSVVAQDLAIAEHHPRGRHILLTGRARIKVDGAMQGAMQRLAMPQCQQLLEDFSDQAGRALRVTVAASGKSAGDLLADLYFADGDDTPQCRSRSVLMAFTEPGSHVVHVCGKRFVQTADRRGLEIVLIHELLHALGLGENPPTSWQITNAVMNRCR